jgi:hypothetical protein
MDRKRLKGSGGWREMLLGWRKGPQKNSYNTLFAKRLGAFLT